MVKFCIYHFQTPIRLFAIFLSGFLMHRLELLMVYHRRVTIPLPSITRCYEDHLVFVLVKFFTFMVCSCDWICCYIWCFAVCWCCQVYRWGIRETFGWSCRYQMMTKCIVKLVPVLFFVHSFFFLVKYFTPFSHILSLVDVD